MRDHSRDIRGVVVHVVTIAHLTRSSVAASVVGNDAIPLSQEVEHLGIPVVTAQWPAMMEHDAMIGGEESGGYAFRGHVPERDGIVSNLYLLDAMVKTGKTPTQLVQALFDKVGAHYYDRIDTRVTDDAIKQAAKAKLDAVNVADITLGGHKVTEKVTIDGYKFVMDDGGWLLVRFSGTEPLIRVYTETTDKAAVQAILADGKKLAGL